MYAHFYPPGLVAVASNWLLMQLNVNLQHLWSHFSQHWFTAPDQRQHSISSGYCLLVYCFIFEQEFFVCFLEKCNIGINVLLSCTRLGFFWKKPFSSRASGRNWKSCCNFLPEETGKNRLVYYLFHPAINCSDVSCKNFCFCLPKKPPLLSMFHCLLNCTDGT